MLAETKDERGELRQRLRSFVGRKGASVTSPDPVNLAMIRHWCVALGDTNPVYLDEQFARTTVHEGLIAPPAMLQAWTMPGYGVAAVKDAVSELYDVLDANGFVGIVATNSDQDYLRPLRLGESITATKTIADVTDVKKTGLGEGVFITTNIDIVDAKGELVGRQLHRVLKFKPAEKPASKPAALRPRPNVTRDTRFFFDGARQHKLLIQCCNACGVLQHPPSAACAACESLDLGHREMSGRGTLYSFTTVHSPVVPPFEPPYVVALVQLAEGVRVVSELHGVPVDAVSIGMKLRVDFLTCDDELTLPIFRPADATAANQTGARNV